MGEMRTDYYEPLSPKEPSYSKSENGETDFLTFVDGEFRLGSLRPAIYFTPSKIVIGCKTASVEAFDELCKRWAEYRLIDKRLIIQRPEGK